MGQPHVIIMSSHSLFAEGIAMRLRQQLGTEDFQTIDAREAGAFEQVVRARPDTVIVEAGDSTLEAYCPLAKLLDALPALRIIRLNVQEEQVQVVTSERKSAAHVSDLINVITAGSSGK